MVRVPVVVVGLVAGCWAAVSLSGCAPAAAPTAASKGTAGAAGKGGASPGAGAEFSNPVQEIEDQLRSALYQLQPENLNIDSRVDDAISVLNNWWAAVETAKLMPTGLAAAELPASRLTPEAMSRLQRNVFDAEDGRYIRGCYLAKRISDHLSAETQTDAERVLKVFQWVCRNVTLRGGDDYDYPVTLYEAVVIGRAAPRDRASVMAAILKQMRIDSVVLTPKSAADANAPWLFGALVQDDCWLFDLRLGLPVPRGDVDVAQRFTTPAALQSLREHPEWLAALSPRAEQPYPLSPEDLNALRVEAVVSTQGWSPRMWAMEQLLPGETLCVLYDAPGTIDQQPGVFERLAAGFPETKPADIGLWEYPQEQEAKLRTMDAVATRALQTDMLPFIVPIETKENKETKQRRPVETMRHLRIRTEQIYGRRNDAISQYITIRQLSVSQAPDPSLTQVYQRAADDAFYWSGVCKFETGEVASAAKLLNDYLKRYRRGGHWVHDARLLLAEAYVALGETAEALKLLRVQESNDPYRDRHAILIRAWSQGDAAPKGARE